MCFAVCWRNTNDEHYKLRFYFKLREQGDQTVFHGVALSYEFTPTSKLKQTSDVILVCLTCPRME